jgi:16S rRNA A1518/A1519 N6-dimethyltransferase RsmA/KsgA/DIM1 with predicted DNA glycosylase/AP lyase activity
MDPSENSWLLRMLLDYPFLPTPLSVIDAALELITLDEGDVFADLGCGDGTVLIQAAKKFQTFCVGFEIDRRLLLEAKRKIGQAGLTNRVDVVNADLFDVDLSRIDAIYVYPFPTISRKLSEKILAESKKGAKVLAYDYPLPNLNPAKSVTVPEVGLHTHQVFLYEL